MGTKSKNPAKTAARRKRLRVIEGLMLNGYSTGEIFDLVGDQYSIEYQTLRNDISDINKAHKDAIDEATELKGKAEFLARTIKLRRRAEADGEIRLTHDLDKDIAKIHGVHFKDDPKLIQLNIELARNEMDKVMAAVFSIVTDPQIQDLIIKAIEDVASEGLQIAPAE